MIDILSVTYNSHWNSSNPVVTHSLVRATMKTNWSCHAAHWNWRWCCFHGGYVPRYNEWQNWHILQRPLDAQNGYHALRNGFYWIYLCSHCGTRFGSFAEVGPQGMACTVSSMDATYSGEPACEDCICGQKKYRPTDSIRQIW